MLHRYVAARINVMNSSECLIIIPAYNEEDTIEEVVSKAKKYADVCVVDDFSSDSTPQILSSINNIHIIKHKVNTHIPGAVMDGLQYAVDNGYEFAVTMDAGLSHNPDEIPLFLQHEYADLVIGSRKQKTNTPLYRELLSFFGNLIYNLTLDFPRSIFKTTYYSDLSSGFRRYSKKAMEILLLRKIKSKNFDFLFESVMCIYRHKGTITEIPITYNYSNSSLNIKTVKDCLVMCLSNLFSCNTRVN